MKNASFALTVAVCLWIPFASRQATAATADIAGEYRIVESSRPDGGGAYRGKVVIESLGAAFQVRWALDSKESYSGPAILQNGVLGVGYGEGLTGLAVYEIKGRTLKAKWLLPATPQQVGDYELTGPASLSGFYKFTNGVAGGVTIKPNGKVYDMLWNLPTGSFGGMGIRVGDVLVAVSGQPGKDFGVVAYRAVGNRVEGVWAVPGQTGLGTEIIVPASASAPVAASTKTAGPSGEAVGFNAAGSDVQFAGETYHLEHNVSAPGQPTAELREYLRPGETFEHYAKMVALRVQDVPGIDPLTFTRNLLQRTKKDYPQAQTNEIEHTGNSATMEFLLVSGSDVEYNLWHYFRTPQGLASVQFVLRNQAPFDTKEKFKAERAAHFDAWVRDVKTLAPQLPDALSKTTQPVKGSTPAKPAAPADDALAAKIQSDLKTAGGIAGNFLELLKANKLNEAASLVADEGLARMKTTRKDFLAQLQQAQRTDGRLLSYAPDRNKVDFGAEAGGIYFVLVADSKCEKATTRETLRFFRFPDGKIKMVGYQHSGKTAPGQ
jgi:hypothetical protein